MDPYLHPSVLQTKILQPPILEKSQYKHISMELCMAPWWTNIQEESTKSHKLVCALESTNWVSVKEELEKHADMQI